MKIYNWRPFLDRWSADWEDSVGTGARWLGSPAVAEERIAELEERLGTALPLTYRSFLAVTDGWRAAGTDIGVVGTAEGLRWYEGPGGEPTGRAGTAGARLRLAVTSDAEVLLDPGEVNADEEWAAYLYRGRPSDDGPARYEDEERHEDEEPERYESFLELMQALFREFHRHHADSPGFANATTRELDADVEEARAGCLSGDDIDRRLDLLIEADRCGRSRAHGLRAQMEAMLGGGPLYAEELSPLAGLEGIGSEEIEEIEERTFRYEPSGAFGKAVATAREQARWGDTGAAWETLADAVADWEPHGSEHIAPVGLLADPLLGPVITPERGRYILETPRGEGRTEGLAESGEPDASALHGAGGGGRSDGGGRAGGWDRANGAEGGDGLAWLADEEDQHQDSYRFLLVEGVSPEDLAARIAREPGRSVTLSAPADEREVGGAARIGSCGGDGGWSFAFESLGNLGPTSVGAAGAVEEFEAVEEFGELGDLGKLEALASRGTASVMVWVERGSESEELPGTFHFSYAEDGQRRYGFTVHGGDIVEWGTLPDTLDPEDFFPGSEELSLDPDDEFEALDAIAEEFEVSLPRFALTQGRLHTVRTRPWSTAA